MSVEICTAKRPGGRIAQFRRDLMPDPLALIDGHALLGTQIAGDLMQFSLGGCDGAGTIWSMNIANAMDPQTLLEMPNSSLHLANYDVRYIPGKS